MFLSQVKFVAALLAIGAVASGAGVLAYQEQEAAKPRPPEVKGGSPTSDERAGAVPAVPNPPVAPAAPRRSAAGSPARRSAVPDSPRILEARLSRAQRLLAIRERQFQAATISNSEIEEARGEVDVLKAELETQRDDLQDELELLQARYETKLAEIEGAEARLDQAMRDVERVRKLAAQNVTGTPEVARLESEAVFQRSQNRVKRAEAGELRVQLKQVHRRLDLLKRLIEKSKGPVQ